MKIGIEMRKVIAFRNASGAALDAIALAMEPLSLVSCFHT